MSIFNSFQKKKPSKTKSSDENYLQDNLEDFSKHDYLGKAADAGQKAKIAVNANEYDKAWGLYHEQKSFYLQHANRCGFTKRQILSLDSQIHENLANILRTEKKNDEALSHILYWVSANNDKPIKKHQQKLTAYFNRCNFENTSLQEAVQFSTSNTVNPDYLEAQSKVAEWMSRE